MKRFKKVSAACLAILMMVGLTSCNETKSPSASSTPASSSPSVSASTAPSGGLSPRGVQLAEPDKKYKISYTGMWSIEYKPGNPSEKLVNEALNVEVEFKKADTTEALNVMLASGEMPDCGWIGKDVSYMYEQELARTIPVDLVKKYAPSYIKNYDQYPVLYAATLNPKDKSVFNYLTGVTFQFVDYYLPNDYYRYDWIENLGINLGVKVEQVHENLFVAEDGIAVDKYTEIMEKFVKNDPNKTGKADTVGMNIPNLAQTAIMTGFGFSTGVNEVNGRGEQFYATPGYKEYLKYLAKMYKDGLLDPQAFQNVRNLSWERVNKEEAGYWITSTNSLQTWAIERPPLTLLQKVPDVKILLTPGLRPEGGKVRARVNSSPAYGTFYINAKIKDEGKLIRILEFAEYTLFGKDRASLFFGEEGIDWEWENGKPKQLNVLPSGEKGTWAFSQFGQDAEVTKWISYEPLFEAGLKYWAKEANGSWMSMQEPPYKEDIKRETNYTALASKANVDINPYVETYRSECVLGNKDVDATWDAYIAELNRMGYKDMMDELNKVAPVVEIIKEFSK